MRFSTYAALNGTCSALIGVLFVIAGFPGLLGDDDGAWWLAVPGLLVVPALLAAAGLRRGIPPTAPGRWLTDRALGDAEPGGSVLDADRLRRRLILETVIWALVALAVILGFTTSRPFAYVTGWASLAYGLVELLASAPRIRAAERDHDRTYLVHRRPGLGTPDLTFR